MEKKITKETTIGEALAIEPGLVHLFSAIGMHCFGCHFSASETIEQAAGVHGVDPDDLMEDIENYITYQNGDQEGDE